VMLRSQVVKILEESSQIVGPGLIDRGVVNMARGPGIVVERALSDCAAGSRAKKKRTPVTPARTRLRMISRSNPGTST